jgi:cytoskeletal protein RodZ
MDDPGQWRSHRRRRGRSLTRLLLLAGILIIVGVVLLIAGQLVRQDSSLPQTPSDSDDDTSGVHFK